jgi:tetratricopeptide (TPR) repeat protein
LTPEPTATPTATARLTATPTPIPTPEIDSEAQNFYYKGLTYAAAGLTEEAVASFDQAIALQADYALAYLERGKLYMQQRQLDQARTDFQYALEYNLDPAVKGEIQSLLQQLASAPTATATLQVEQATPTPQATVIIASGPAIEAQLGQPFSLPLGGTATLEEANLTLVFQSVLEDSRCPRQIECFWAGQVRIMIEAQQEGTAAVTFELNNNPPLKQDTITYAGYEIQLLQIDPYPEAPGQPIPPEAYQATLVVNAK